MKIFFKGIAVMLWLAGCTHKSHTVTPAFYYWKTSFLPTGSEQQAIRGLGMKKLYLRCFDVDWNETSEAPEPVAVIRLPPAVDTVPDYVPVVFITQKAIAAITPKSVSALAKKMGRLLEELCGNSSIAPKEIQIDCDWTAGSREAYFALLQALRRENFFAGKRLSCTIRLHQLKYRQRSGIPPADRGMLMCYNVGNLKRPTAHNSILDVPLAKDYLAHLDTYPLPLDVALPLFSWCVLFRQGVFSGIIRDAEPAELASAVFSRTEANLYTVLQDTLWHGYSLHNGDIIRAEKVSFSDLASLATFTSAHLRNDSATVTFFHLDSVVLSHYSTDELKKILGRYR